ncbi:hypothetical protein EJ04DRAFT_504427 [Polyplosphaeria fusca]|uniref:Chromatin assembly factor 1 subunit A n=1 Tax=Polyplosphaeria fusca TaxID=682080 RepID=A0A9P4QM92_9PLEO|nr:hypothetical protein EJ04DRAFT_504427 [Polyplosphaeria fusca]
MATLSQPHKRPLEEDAAVPVTTPTKPPPSEASTPLTVLSTIPSPSFSKEALSQSTPLVVSSGSTVAPTDTQPTTKKRKLTDKEKEDKKLEKEAKERAKAEQKAQKEEAKRVKDEEKRKKDEEKEEKKRAKELAQQQKEETIRKKDQNQMKLNSFFSMKTDVVTPANKIVDANDQTAPEQTYLKPDVTMQEADTIPKSPQKARLQNAQSDYERFFLPFQLPSRAILAPYNRFMEDTQVLHAAKVRLDQVISGDCPSDVDVKDLVAKCAPRLSRGMTVLPLVDILERLNGTLDSPIDLTSDKSASQQAVEALSQVPMKYLHFPEDVRPPYYGTYTKPHSPREALKLARAPSSRILHELNYDYDSEAEWDEPEEGEDLDSEGEDDLDSEGDEEMEGFLDDEDDAQLKRRMISSDLIPNSTGLCWEDPQGVSRLNDRSDAICTDFKGFKTGFLLDPQPQSIDPFSTSYWAPEPAPVPAKLAAPSNAASTGMMNPPRHPLAQRQVNNMINTLKVQTPATTPKAAKPPKRMILAELLPEFRNAIEGSDMTKIALIEHLKRLFPKQPKDAIANTLSANAARVGAKEKEKRWVWKDIA